MSLQRLINFIMCICASLTSFVACDDDPNETSNAGEEEVTAGEEEEVTAGEEG